MKKSLILGLLMVCGTALSATAAEETGGKTLTPEQQRTRDSIIAKYDANGDGALDKAEQKKTSKADKKALAKTGGIGTAGKGAKVKPAGEDAEKVKATKEKPAKEPTAEPKEKAKETKEAKPKGKK